MITLDTTRADHLGIYGYPLPTSPEIDEFARDAVVFRRAWSTAGWTLPSHASMVTGMYPSSHGAQYDERLGEPMFGSKVSRLGDDVVSIAEVLRDAGYQTAAFAGGPWLSPEFGVLQGFDIQEAGVKGKNLLDMKPKERKAQPKRHADVLTDDAIAWLRNVPRTRPLHLLVNYFDPHGPYNVRPGFEITGHESPADEKLAVGYDSEIRFMDHHFGRLIDELKALSRFDNALIIVVADHGESFWEHGFFSHGSWMYEELLRVPLIIRFPRGRDGGDVVDTMVSTVDFFPLVARETGVALPPGVEGLPLGQRQFAMAQGPKHSGFVKMFGPRMDRDLTAFVRWPWKLIVGSKGPSELYNLELDPKELQDRAGDAAEKELQLSMDAVLTTLAPRAEPVDPIDVDPALKERLRALGYIE